MSAKHVETELADPSTIDQIAREVLGFVEAWRASSLASMGIDPDGAGSVRDIHALDYAIYESVDDLITPADKSFIAMSVPVFGTCLKSLLGFEWCRVKLSTASLLGMKHPWNGLVVPLEPIIASHLSGNPQYENFEYLFFKILRSSHLWPMGTHFLEESSWRTESGEFERHWGFAVPESIRKRYVQLSAMDEEYTIRRVGLHAYDWARVPNWEEIDRRLSEIERDIRSVYGEDWKVRLKARNPEFEL